LARSIVLIYPNAGQDVLGINVGLPLSLLYVGTALKEAGYSVRILDERILRDFARSLKEALASDPLFVGISTMTGYQIRHGLKIAQSVRTLDPRVPLVWGGVHPTIDPDSTIQHNLVDAVVIGDGEETAVDLARALESGAGLHQIRGIAFKDGEQVVRTDQRAKLDLERLPEPDYSLVDLDDYYTIGHISRATTADCNKPWLPFPLRLLLPAAARSARVSDDIRATGLRRDTASERGYGVQSIFFYDDYFFGDRARC
jgi:radical SAM superfamily enzyme YgiQ (UPF0313 family)